MKKLIFLLLLLSVISITYVVYNISKEKIKEISEINKILDKVDFIIDENSIELDNMYIYGNNLNIEGKIASENIKNIELLIQSYDKEIIELNLTKEDEEITFKLSETINNGLLLDKYNNVLYLLFIRITDFNNNYKYHRLVFNEELEYYTLTNNRENYKISINKNNKFNTLNFFVTKNTEEVYDIILDPGHGGIDSGACLYKNKTCERDYTSNIVRKIKNKLENYGYKVAYTWDIDEITNNDIIPTYGVNSRTGKTYESHAKYLFSIHLNSSATRKGSGFEIYTPYNIDYTLATIMRDKLNEVTNYSSNTSHKVFNGIYTRTFTTYDLEDIRKEREKNKLENLDVSTKTNYYYMIRETAGKLGDAYVDGTTNSEGSINPYRDNLVTSEGYIIELAYISNANDVKHINENTELYIDAIVSSIIEYLEYEKSAN